MVPNTYDYNAEEEKKRKKKLQQELEEDQEDQDNKKDPLTRIKEADLGGVNTWLKDRGKEFLFGPPKDATSCEDYKEKVEDASNDLSKESEPEKPAAEHEEPAPAPEESEKNSPSPNG